MSTLLRALYDFLDNFARAEFEARGSGARPMANLRSGLNYKDKKITMIEE